MADHEAIQGISGVGRTEDKKMTKAIGANKAHFDALMEQDNKAKTEEIAQKDVKKPDLEQVVADKNKIGPLEKLDTQAIVDETKNTLTTIEQIKLRLESKLAQADMSMNKAYNPILKNKLTHVDDNLRIALSKAGVDFDPSALESAIIPPAANPFERFLGHLSHAQFSLENLGEYLESASAEGRNLGTEDLLAVQIKVQRVQQELEFFSNMLNKALESIKTIGNVQI